MALDDDPKFWQGFNQEETHAFIEDMRTESKELDREKTILIEGMNEIIKACLDSKHDTIFSIAEKTLSQVHCG
jgi:hypothetical protein